MITLRGGVGRGLGLGTPPPAELGQGQWTQHDDYDDTIRAQPTAFIVMREWQPRSLPQIPRGPHPSELDPSEPGAVFCALMSATPAVNRSLLSPLPPEPQGPRAGTAQDPPQLCPGGQVTQPATWQERKRRRLLKPRSPHRSFPPAWATVASLSTSTHVRPLSILSVVFIVYLLCARSWWGFTLQRWPTLVSTQVNRSQFSEALEQSPWTHHPPCAQ